MTPETESKTLRIERHMAAPAERIYEAYLDPDAAARYMAPEGTTVEHTEMDVRVGGRYAYTMRPTEGEGGQGFEGTFLELEPGKRIRHTYAFVSDNEAMKVPMEITLTFEETDGGTRVVFEQQGIPAPIPVEHAKAAYAEMLDRMAAHVEA